MSKAYTDKKWPSNPDLIQPGIAVTTPAPKNVKYKSSISNVVSIQTMKLMQKQHTYDKTFMFIWDLDYTFAEKGGATAYQ